MMPMAKTPKPARNHHWVSQCYLKGFATPVSKNSNLWAYDFAEDHSFRPKPRGVAAQRDFNRIDVPGQPMDALEGALAEFERNLIRERTRAGLAAARARGREGGRPKALDHQKRELLYRLYDEKQHTIKEICQLLGVSKPTLYAYLRHR